MTDIKYHATVKDNYGTYDSVEQWQKSFRGDPMMNYPKDAAQGLNDQAMARGMYGTAAHQGLVGGLAANIESKATPLLVEIENRLSVSNDMLDDIVNRLMVNLDRALGGEPTEVGTLTNKTIGANINACHASQIIESLDTLMRRINAIGYQVVRLERIL